MLLLSVPCPGAALARTVKQERVKHVGISWEGAAEVLTRSGVQEGRDNLLPQRPSQEAARV